MGSGYLPVLFLSCLYAVRPLSDFSFITVLPELLPVTYPRCCSLISCPDYLAHITDKQANRFLLLQCSVFYFHSICVCVYARVFVRARLRSHDGYPSLAVFVALLCPALSTPLPWLSQRLSHRCKKNKTLTAPSLCFCSFFCRTRQGWSHRTSWTICRQRRTQFSRCVFVYP